MNDERNRGRGGKHEEVLHSATYVPFVEPVYRGAELVPLIVNEISPHDRRLRPVPQLSCPDPLFDPKRPIEVNGFRYVPLDSAADFVGRYGHGLESFHSTAPAFVSGAAEALRKWGGEPE